MPVARFAVVTYALCLLATQGAAQGSLSEKRPITVDDAIAMTRLGEGDYFSGGDEWHAAHFSPNGKLFVVVLRRGNIKRNTNDFTLYLFQTRRAFDSPTPHALVMMSSSSNRDAIQSVKWLPDNETVAFLGEKPGEVPQVYTFNVRTERLARQTHSATVIYKYDISYDSREILYEAERARPSGVSRTTPTEGSVISRSYFLDSIAASDSKPFVEGGDLFIQRRGIATRIPVTADDVLAPRTPLCFSPHAKRALIGFLRGSNGRKLLGSACRYLVLEINSKSTVELPKTQSNACSTTAWQSDDNGIFMRDTSEPSEVRPNDASSVMVKLPSGEIRHVGIEEWPKETRTPSNVSITLIEDPNTPPQLFAEDVNTSRRTLLLDLNPQFAKLNFGKVENVAWKAKDGNDWRGGLYLPPDYRSDMRYPLVIQTHGYNSRRFSMDGLQEWSSAFAARMLASQGIIVLQTNGIPFFGDVREGAGYEAGYEGAIDYLNERSFINRDHVGIAGFSRTVYDVGYTLTHSQYRFSAATLVDGITGGYFESLVFESSSEADMSLNGAPMYGEGLNLWLRNSPTFNLDKVHVPVRVLTMGPMGPLKDWEWFAGLMVQKKPVELINIDGGAHILQKPWERRIAMQGMVDWFRFWLNSEEDCDPGKREQYVRWHQFRDVEEQNPVSAGAKRGAN